MGNEQSGGEKLGRNGEILHDTGATGGYSEDGEVESSCINENFSSRIQIFVSCSNLANRDKDIGSKSDPFAVVFVRPSSAAPWTEVGRTEIMMNNLNPQFNKPVNAVYLFEEMQEICVRVFDCDSNAYGTNAEGINYLDTRQVDDLGQNNPVVLADVINCVGTPGQLSVPLLPATGRAMFAGALNTSRRQPQLTLRVEELTASNQVISMKWGAQGLANLDGAFGKSDPFVVISRCPSTRMSMAASLSGHQPQPLPVYKSEVINNDLNPQWNAMHLSMATLCNGDPRRLFELRVFDYDTDGSHDLIGFATTTVAQLQAGMALPLQRHSKGKTNQRGGTMSKKKLGVLRLLEVRITQRASFLEYIRAGTELNFMLAIDFTGSNGHQSHPNSLHRLDATGSNQYTHAIHAIGDVLEHYDTDRRYPVWGFGALVSPQGPVSHCFNLSPDGEPVHGVQGILQAYRQALPTLQFSGPTNFSEIIATASSMVHSAPRDGTQYTVLTILTDGEITDMGHTIEAIVAASSLPMSILIVGVGNGSDFVRMGMLDGDDVRLQSRVTGEVASRDIVQFVPLRDFATPEQGDMLRRELLHEIPGQVTSWMRKNHIVPSSVMEVSNVPHAVSVSHDYSSGGGGGGAPAGGSRGPVRVQARPVEENLPMATAVPL